jgi:hypothetical protein
MIGLLRELWQDRRGSFVLDASVVFPLVFISVLLMLLLSLAVYQRAIVYYSASAAAEKAAFRWDNSYRDMLTGRAPTGQYDRLYWRLADNRMLEGIFGSPRGNARDPHDVLLLPIMGDEEREGDLVSIKIRRAAARIDPSFSGEARLDQANPLLRQVRIELHAPSAIESVQQMIGRGASHAAASSAVVDPVEFTRLVDLARYYAAKFGSGTGGKAKRGQAQAVLEEKDKQAGGGDAP